MKNNEHGQTVIEYVLVLVLIVLLLVLAFDTASVDEAIGRATDRVEEHMLEDE
jgi:Flp pilus assembly pilin Flp